MKDLSAATITQLSADYIAAAAAHGQATRSGDARAANRQYRLLSSVTRELLRRGVDGQDVIVAHLRDADPAIRLWAAAHALEFAPERAERTLGAIASGPPSPERLDAEMTLREWHAGRLRRV